MQIRVETLGTLRVLAGDRELDDLYQHRSLVAMLIYLAVQRRARRDVVMSVFWPDSDAANARHALRQVLYRLRHALPDSSWLASRGDELLARETLTSDVGDFDAAVAALAFSPMAALYRAPFLEGVHLLDVSPWQHWVDAQRARLARAHRQSCRQWIKRCLEGGDFSAAVAAAQAWVDPEPFDDEAQQCLIELLARAGHRQAALQQYDSFERALKAEGLTPLEETRALRRRLEEGQRQPAAAASDATESMVLPAETLVVPAMLTALTTAGPDHADPGEAPGQRQARPSASVRARHGRRIAVGGTLAIAAVILLFGRWSVPESSMADNVVAVFPFTARTPALTELGIGMMELLGSALDGAGELKASDPFAIDSRLGRTAVARVDLEEARAIARELGAGLFVTGSVTEYGQDIRIAASAYDAADMRSRVASTIVTGPREHVPRLIEQVASELLKQLPLGAGARLRDRDPQPAVDYDALMAYLNGERLFRHGQFDSAVVMLIRAVQLDSTFALAWYRLARAQSYSSRTPHDVGRSLERATRYSDQLSARDRLLTRAFAAFIGGAADSALAAAEAATGLNPRHVEPWHLLMSSRLWYGWQRGLPYTAAWEAAREALQLDPDYPELLFHASSLEMYLGHYDEARVLFERTPHVTARVAAARIVLPLVQRRPTSRAEMLPQLAALDDRTLDVAARLLALYTDSLDAAEYIWTELAEARPHSAELRARTRLHSALLHIARGRWEAARQSFAGVIDENEILARVYPAWLAAAPFARVPAHERRALRDSLLDWTVPPPGSGVGMLENLTVPPALNHCVRDYLAGLLSASIGDAEDALRRAQTLESEAHHSLPELRRDLALEIRALVALQQGRPAEGLALLEQASLSVGSFSQVYESPFFTRWFGRLLRAELLYELGRDQEALDWYGTFGFFGGSDFVVAAHTHMRRGQIYDRLGQYEEAVQHYRRFVARWRNADHPRRDAVAAVERRMREIQRLHTARALSPLK